MQQNLCIAVCPYPFTCTSDSGSQPVLWFFATPSVCPQAAQHPPTQHMVVCLCVCVGSLCFCCCVCRCSETGAAFFNDMFSKHAMHSGGQEEVLYAGGCPACRCACFAVVFCCQRAFVTGSHLGSWQSHTASNQCVQLSPPNEATPCLPHPLFFVCAGEFCIVPCPGAAGGHKLVIDNNRWVSWCWGVCDI